MARRGVGRGHHLGEILDLGRAKRVQSGLIDKEVFLARRGVEFGFEAGDKPRAGVARLHEPLVAARIGRIFGGDRPGPFGEFKEVPVLPEHELPAVFLKQLRIGRLPAIGGPEGLVVEIGLGLGRGRRFHSRGRLRADPDH